jgi:hypothetical protein
MASPGNLPATRVSIASVKLARRLVLFTLLLGACAAPRPAPSPSPAEPAKLLPRSSVAAVLAHRTELGLDDDQVRKLEAIDEDLQRRNAALGSRSTSSAGDSPRAGASPSEGARPGSEGASGEGSGGHRGGRRGAGGGPGSREDHGRTAVDPERISDQNDTAAYYRAEEVLRPEQRDRARELAESYREDLYDQRAAKNKPAAH